MSNGILEFDFVEHWGPIYAYLGCLNICQPQKLEYNDKN